jgi:hypothetical protein
MLLQRLRPLWMVAALTTASCEREASGPVVVVSPDGPRPAPLPPTAAPAPLLTLLPRPAVAWRPAVPSVAPPPPPPPALPRPVSGSCVWGIPPAAPPLSSVAQFFRNRNVHPMYPTTLPVPVRATFIRSALERNEGQLAVWDILDRQGTISPQQASALVGEPWVLAIAYAELELLEDELCATATVAGAQKDFDAATAARRRTDDLCARLRHSSRPTPLCP